MLVVFIEATQFQLVGHNQRNLFGEGSVGLHPKVEGELALNVSTDFLA